MRKKAPIIKTAPNKPRIFEAVLFLISEADRLRKFASQYDIVKSVFLADRRHLNEYGRPITFDRYVAMEHGPVPSSVYDLLKADPQTAGFPWSKTRCDERIYQFSNAARAADDNILSDSDFEALAESFVTVKSLGFHQIRKLTHEDPAYVDAWEDGGGAKAYDMSYVMLFDVPDFEKAADIGFISENI
ncbi:Panacea domain-containing protein [uncultured Roseibium sp.]|uniref:Panacea domain-containing protein n=1 Tax=uncultured Roseibium sp. TaxID=1936171 RepID=UPI002635FDA9|nr:Panacea domain-containing protein [uncultured Roseibium sp.]